MTEAVERLKSQATNLNSHERADLAYFLLTSLEPENDAVSEEWRLEIDRRVSEIRAGTARGRNADEALAELRELHP